MNTSSATHGARTTIRPCLSLHIASCAYTRPTAENSELMQAIRARTPIPAHRVELVSGVHKFWRSPALCVRCQRLVIGVDDNGSAFIVSEVDKSGSCPTLAFVAKGSSSGSMKVVSNLVMTGKEREGGHEMGDLKTCS